MTLTPVTVRCSCGLDWTHNCPTPPGTGLPEQRCAGCSLAGRSQCGDLRQRAEQAEDLLRVAHETSNRAEAERARAEATIERMKRTNRMVNGGARQNRKRAEAALDRVRAYATHLFNHGNTRHAQDGLHILALIDDQPEHTLIDGRGQLRAALDQQEQPASRVHLGGNAEDCPACHDSNPPYPFICPGPTA